MAAACLLAVLVIPAGQATPGAGALDPGFGSGGKVTTPIGTLDSHAYGLALQPDGKAVAAGTSTNGVTLGDFALARYNPNGSLDTSFNGTGKVTTAIGPSWDVAYAIVRQPDGKLVAAGTSNTGSNFDFALARYNPNGSLDTSFNGTGKVTTPIGPGNDEAMALVLQPDGKLVVAGRSDNGSQHVFAVTRYNPNGSLDTTFNGTGKVTTAIGSAEDEAYALALQPDGKLVVAGHSRTPSKTLFALVRYNPNGSLDTTFNGTGKVTTAMGVYGSVNDLVLQPDGKLLVGGAGDNGSHLAFALARYNANGSLDTSFNGTGKVMTAIGSAQDDVIALAQQPDGKVLAAGYSYVGSTRVFALARYNTNGSLDASFSGAGKVTTAIGSIDDEAYAVALQPDGKLVAAGNSYNGNQQVFALVRYLGNTLTVSRSGSGSGTVTSSPNGIDCGPTCSAQFASVPVQLSATAAPGSSFVGWSGDCSGTAACALTMSADHAATAVFETDKTLKLKKAGAGAGKVISNPAGIRCGSTCTHVFRHGTAVTLRAKTTSRARFAGWSGACAGTGRCTVQMTAARSVTATFKRPCIVPKLKGKTLRTAKRAIRKAHCSVGKVKKTFSARMKKGRVISPKPRAGKRLAPGAKVKLRVSKGTKT